MTTTTISPPIRLTTDLFARSGRHAFPSPTRTTSRPLTWPIRHGSPWHIATPLSISVRGAATAQPFIHGCFHVRAGSGDQKAAGVEVSENVRRAS